MPAELADALADWIDADSEPRPRGGAEDGYYLELEQPYLAANRPLIDVAELALVRGFDGEVRARLRPFVTALPRFTAVNVNTAAPEVLAAIVEDLTLDAARALVAKRERAYFRNNADFLSQLPHQAVAPAEDIAVSSDVLHGDDARNHRRRGGARHARCSRATTRGGPPSSGASCREPAYESMARCASRRNSVDGR